MDHMQPRVELRAEDALREDSLVELVRGRVEGFAQHAARVEQSVHEVLRRSRARRCACKLRATKPGLIERARRKGHPRRRWPRGDLSAPCDAA